MDSCMQVKQVNSCLKDEKGVAHDVEDVLVQVRGEGIHEPIPENNKGGHTQADQLMLVAPARAQKR